MKKLILFIILLFPLVSFSQKYFIRNGDTLLLSDRKNRNSIPCHSFEIRDGRVINQRTGNCIPFGFWILENRDSTISEGSYTMKGNRTGLWKTFDKTGVLSKEVEYIDSEVVKEVHYENGKTIIISQAKWFTIFYLRYGSVIGISYFVLLFIHGYMNSVIYNRRDGTNYSFFYFESGFVRGFNMSEERFHPFLSMVTFWWFLGKLKPEIKPLARVSNLLSFILAAFFIWTVVWFHVLEKS